MYVYMCVRVCVFVCLRMKQNVCVYRHHKDKRNNTETEMKKKKEKKPNRKIESQGEYHSYLHVLIQQTHINKMIKKEESSNRIVNE